ncbi:MAG: glycosyltransferase [Bacteroidia bacterium]
MLIAVALIVSLFFLVQISCLFWILAEKQNEKLVWLLKTKKSELDSSKEWPKVSLFLAARNEEKLIMRSLEAISLLDYPKDKLEVLIGNDDSTDKTKELVLDFISDRENFKLIDIKHNLGKGRGKANVLAHLAHEASGEFYFITDVDVQLPPSWIKGMLSNLNEEVGIASGMTMCERGSWFADMQSIDWLHFMGYIKAFAKIDVACTSVGNNMMVRADAYWQTGGYENIDFSITEDYKLFKEVTSNGWRWKNELNSKTLGLAWYIPSVKEMLHQRKRWLIGARELPLNWKILIILYGLFIPALFLLFMYSPLLAGITWFLKLMAQSLFITILCQKLKVKPFRFYQLLFYEIYVIINTLATAVFYLLPIKSVWKGRKYNSSNLTT